MAAARAQAGIFEVIPAIDLLEGSAVRLTQGRYDAATVYDRDPASVAARFVAAGARRVHVVDLEGAKAGRPVQGDAVKRILAAAGDVPVQMGGGLRTLEGVDEALGWGLDRVILGTVALRDPALVKEAAGRHPRRIVVGIDARDGRVAVEGWLEASETTAVDLGRRFEDAGVAAIVYTDIARDGMLTGPNLDQTVALAESVGIPVIVSGGVATNDDILRSAALRDRNLCGVIVGRAIYTGGVDLEAAIRAVEEVA
ncbi:MAG: 1-(5-phosphoribosyl)-5-[(5-phosphoribosylamino)methylideneamino]imidazole-4-carboxamide isomerase [Spirochaetaceae bacterium]|nr:1-(5-phosphoribosyl)-5-[(5-phosphoribosylamino)methylideneamino]imidazole-4-carboxamide isomerase [Myxococcales bacterium]MCB9724094.1 1-(5-phosphoribosyl)-5-[(5-phosphoribosylamino)methylideneamino]imidazole-4-carboxamide isomerase [Spirochaetaceae bacterium]HPG27232.1 1-(5-phosphoribosyl)-5-[(5-phosphoribosylamino)methylideneamino]imidazole-4-carboxamide isomerase [Myxococcota bacterium]